MTPSAVIYVQDLDRMRAFYEAVFGFGAVDESDEFCVLESAGLTLYLVVAGVTVERAGPPARRANTPIKLGFPVASIADLRPVVHAAGGTVDPREKQWEFRGAIHCDAVDPEGNVLQLIEAVVS